MKSPLTCTVISVEEQTVTLRFPNGDVQTLPLSCVHGTPIPDGVLRLMAVVPEGGRTDDSIFAKTILNELLSPPRP